MPKYPLEKDEEGEELRVDQNDKTYIFVTWEVVNQVEPTIGSYLYWQGQYDMNKTGIIYSPFTIF